MGYRAKWNPKKSGSLDSRPTINHRTTKEDTGRGTERKE